VFFCVRAFVCACVCVSEQAFHFINLKKHERERKKNLQVNKEFMKQFQYKLK